MCIVWLVRHGESESNAGLPVHYPDGTGLTARGLREAEAVAAAVERPPRLIVVSPYRRTGLSAAPLLERFPSVPVATWPVQEFTPISIAPGQLTTNLERRPLLERYWDQPDPDYCAGPHAESLNTMLSRAAELQASLLAQPEGFIVVFSHATFLRGFTWALWRRRFVAERGDGQRFHSYLRGLHFPNGAYLPLHVTDNQCWVGGLVTEHLADLDHR